MALHNRINKDELKQRMLASDEKRVTISFYKYHKIDDPQQFRDDLYKAFDTIGVMGRIYVASEGINGQISVPYKRFADFEKYLESINFMKGIRLNLAIEDDGKSFFMLKIKVRNKIVADGIEDPGFDPEAIGRHLSAEEFNALTSQPETVLIDMRNHYESEVGHFQGAWCPDVDTFREQLPLVADELGSNKKKNIVMYCTGGIRCEKASAYMRYKGFENVYQLEGGIIKYTRDTRAQGLPNKFLGKNFVFDERLEEKITDDVIAKCHQCGTAFDHHTNCANKACNLLFIQCPSCAEKHEGTCSIECQEFIHLPESEQKKLRKGIDYGVRIFSKGRFKRLNTGGELV